MANMPSGCWEKLNEIDHIIAGVEAHIVDFKKSMVILGFSMVMTKELGRLNVQLRTVELQRSELVAAMADTLKKKKRITFAPTEELERVRLLWNVRPRADAFSTEVAWMELLLDDDRKLEVVAAELSPEVK